MVFPRSKKYSKIKNGIKVYQFQRILVNKANIISKIAKEISKTRKKQNNLNGSE